jgi:hypothetical protein
MPEENSDLIPLSDAIAELNRRLSPHRDVRDFYALQTAYSYAASGRIPSVREGRFRFVRRSDLPVIAACLPLGGRTSSASSAA